MGRLLLLGLALVLGFAAPAAADYPDKPVRLIVPFIAGSTPDTAARRIALEDARRFEAVHERVYREHGFELVSVEPASVIDRAGLIRRCL